MAQTTKLIPGNFQPFKISLKKFLGQSIHLFCRGNFKASLFCFIAGAGNVKDGLMLKKRKPRFYCPCCWHKSYSLVHLPSDNGVCWNSACPVCGSRSRHRGLFKKMRELSQSKEQLSVLHFAPERVFVDLFKNSPNVSYRTADLNLTDVDYPSENLESLTLRSASFDRVLCNHVLEHVENDEKAVSEIFRVLKPGGEAWITIPGAWNGQPTRQYDRPTSNGHWRHYGLDVQVLFEKYFDHVLIVWLQENLSDSLGLSLGILSQEPLFVLRKTKNAK